MSYKRIRLLIPSVRMYRFWRDVLHCIVGRGQVYLENIYFGMFAEAKGPMHSIVALKMGWSLPTVWLINNRALAQDLLSSKFVERYAAAASAMSVTGHHGVITCRAEAWHRKRADVDAAVRNAEANIPQLAMRRLVAMQFDWIHGSKSGPQLASLADIERSFQKLSFKIACKTYGLQLDDDLVTIAHDVIRLGLQQLTSTRGVLRLAAQKPLGLRFHLNSRRQIECWRACLHAAIDARLNSPDFGSAPSDYLLARHLQDNGQEEASKDESAEEIFQMLVATFETVASILTSAVFLLTRVDASEVSTVHMNPDGEYVADRQAIGDLYVETINNLPSLPFVQLRRATERIGISTVDGRGLNIRADDLIVIPTKFYASQPLRRFTVSKPTATLPYSSGPHTCPGSRFARAVFLDVMAPFVEQYGISSAFAKTTGERTINESFIVSEQGVNFLQIYRRSAEGGRSGARR